MRKLIGPSSFKIIKQHSTYLGDPLHVDFSGVSRVLLVKALWPDSYRFRSEDGAYKRLLSS